MARFVAETKYTHLIAIHIFYKYLTLNHLYQIILLNTPHYGEMKIYHRPNIVTKNLKKIIWARTISLTHMGQYVQCKKMTEQ